MKLELTSPPGDAAAAERFEALYRSTASELWVYASHRVGHDDAREHVAETYVAAWRKFQDGLEHEVTMPWLVTVCRNRIIDQWRATGRWQGKTHLLGPRPATDDLSIDLVLRDAVVRALDSLSTRNRTLLILHHVDGLSVADLARQTGSTRRAIESALARGRRDFRNAYEEARHGR